MKNLGHDSLRSGLMYDEWERIWKEDVVVQSGDFPDGTEEHSRTSVM
jgi:hypothetical protein